jgi:hypothetical protein
MECRAIASLLSQQSLGIQDDSELEPVAKPDRRLGPVGYAVGAQRRGEVEGRLL